MLSPPMMFCQGRSTEFAATLNRVPTDIASGKGLVAVIASTANGLAVVVRCKKRTTDAWGARGDASRAAEGQTA